VGESHTASTHTWGESCKGPTPLANLKSFLLVVHLRVLENPLVPRGGQFGMRLALYKLCRSSGRAQKKKTDSLSVPNCKMYIKPIAGTKVPYFGVTKDKISTFVTKKIHTYLPLFPEP